MNKILLAALLSLLVVGRATASPDRASLDQGIRVDGAHKVAFRYVRVKTNEDGTSSIRGALDRLGPRPVRFGHLVYTLSDSRGKVLETGQTDYSGAITRRRSRGYSHFSIPLKRTWRPGFHRFSIAWKRRPYKG